MAATSRSSTARAQDLDVVRAAGSGPEWGVVGVGHGGQRLLDPQFL